MNDEQHQGESEHVGEIPQNEIKPEKKKSCGFCELFQTITYKDHDGKLNVKPWAWALALICALGLSILITTTPQRSCSYQPPTPPVIDLNLVNPSHIHITVKDGIQDITVTQTPTK